MMYTLKIGGKPGVVQYREESVKGKTPAKRMARKLIRESEVELSILIENPAGECVFEAAGDKTGITVHEDK